MNPFAPPNLVAPVVAVLLLLVARAADAQLLGEAEPTERAGRRIGSLFPQGTNDFTTEFRYVVGVEDGEDLPAVSLGYDYYFINNLSLGAELTGYGFFDGTHGSDDTGGVALGARLRHHVVAGENASFFLSVAFAPFYGFDDVPADGTRLNFVSRAGVGGTLRLGDNCFLIGTLDFWHLSNGQIVGDSNPAINGVQAGVGIGFRL